jgi:VanZ family protein
MAMPSTQFMLRRSAIAVFWLAMAFAFYCAVAPVEKLHLGDRDKVEHVLAFFTLTILCTVAYPRRALAVSGLKMLAFGAFIEIVQSIPALGRQADVADLVADGCAILAAISVMAATGLRFRMLRLLRPTPDFVHAVHGR